MVPFAGPRVRAEIQVASLWVLQLKLFYGLMISCETDGHESKPSSKGRSLITTGEKPHSYRGRERRATVVLVSSSRGSVVRFGCSYGITCPAITVGTIILRALDRVRESALGSLGPGDTIVFSVPPAGKYVLGSPTGGKW